MSITPFLEVNQAIAAMGGDTLNQCMQCGLCAGLCPWGRVVKGSPFVVRKLIRMGQLGMEGFESDEILYACTTCNLCVRNCPRQVAIIDVIRSMRAMIAETGAIPQNLRPILGSVHSHGNPWAEKYIEGAQEGSEAKLTSGVRRPPRSRRPGCFVGSRARARVETKHKGTETA